MELSPRRVPSHWIAVDKLAIRLSKVKEQARCLSYDLVETISDREVSLWAREAQTVVFSRVG